MCTVAIGMAIGWGIVLEVAKKMMFDALPNTKWWHRAIKPQQSMMANFGFPTQPTKKFPNGMTEPMARDFYAFLVAICSQHTISALAMMPVMIYGWEESSDTVKSLFILGTLSDLGFDIYDAITTSIRTFTKNHPNPIPIEFWIIIVAMHHTLALTLLFPMNLFYAHRFEYHQTAFSLLMAAGLCYGLGCYKFSLNIIEKKFDFVLYKALVLCQLAIILYTRVYLWFPATLSFRNHLREQNDMVMFYGASVLITIFSLFNIILVVDGFKAAIKCIPKKFGKTQKERERASIVLYEATAIDAPGMAAIQELRKFMARRRFKGAVHSVIAAQRMGSSCSGVSDNSEKDKAQ